MQKKYFILMGFIPFLVCACTKPDSTPSSTPASPPVSTMPGATSFKLGVPEIPNPALLQNQINASKKPIKKS
jgi:hypothetical protein